jgi:outer membrane protein OmpA-like peptidoglycan-associated protein
MGTLLPAHAQQVTGAKIDSCSLTREGDNLRLDMVLNTEGLRAKSQQAVILTPEITNGTDVAQLSSVGVYSRNRYYYYKRQADDMITGSDERVLRNYQVKDTLHYSSSIPYESWMNGSSLVLTRNEYGCCGSSNTTETADIASYFDSKSFLPTLLYVEPAAVVQKSAELEGRANILFVVNKTNIDPTYRDNTNELRKIYAVLDSVRGDRDITVTSVALKGFASPEGTYAHNTYLATNRTLAIRDYIAKLYDFDKKTISTASEPEDWEGAKAYISASKLPHKAEILKIISTVSDPDARDNKIRTDYPEEYKTLLNECYPTLRHTNYQVKYNIRSYTDVEEMKKVFAENPGKLSLNELYLVAQSYGKDTKEYDKVMQAAALLYPNDETAALNAANAALTEGDLTEAANYLSRAGNSAKADYTRGVLAIKNGDFSGARTYLKSAQAAGITEATPILELISKY